MSACARFIQNPSAQKMQALDERALCRPSIEPPGKGENMRAITLVLAALAVLIFGCEASVRRPAQNVTLGALDAFQHPPPDAELATKIGKLANRYLDQALAAEPPEAIEDLSANATRGVLRGLGQTAVESGPALRGSLRTAMQALSEQSPVFGQIVGRAGHEAAGGLVRRFGHDPEALALLQDAAFGAGRAVTSGATDELARRTEAWVGPDGRGPLGEAMAAIAARSGEFVIAGALGAIRQDLQNCVPGKDEMCLSDMMRSLSRSAGRGASEGVVREFDWLTAGVAFAGGLVAAILAAFAVNALRNNRHHIRA